jgi:hypothetical protein
MHIDGSVIRVYHIRVYNEEKMYCARRSSLCAVYLKQIVKNRKIKNGCAFTRKKINMKEKQTRGHMILGISVVVVVAGKKKRKYLIFFYQEKSMERFLEIKKIQSKDV